MANAGLFFFLAVGAVALFTFIAVAHWSGERKEERLAFYHSELLKKLSEQHGEGAQLVLELVREKAIRNEREKRQSLALGGMVTSAVGIGLIAMFAGLHTRENIWTIGLIPLLIGLVLLLFSRFGMRPQEEPGRISPPGQPT